MGYNKLARSNMTVSKICIGSMRASLEDDVRLWRFGDRCPQLAGR